MPFLYEIVEQELPPAIPGRPALLVHTVNRRGKFTAESSVKVIPPTLVYDQEGNFKVVDPTKIIDAAEQSSVVHKKRYNSRSSDFNEARLADTNVSNFYKYLEPFPTVPKGPDGLLHPMALASYQSLVYLEPSVAFDEELRRTGFSQRSRLKAAALSKLAERVWQSYKVRLDLHSVPKRGVGTFCYVAGEDGIAPLVKALSFGFHNAIPADRAAREFSSLKNAEKFSTPAVLPTKVPSKIRPYCTSLRVGIVWVKHKMLDSGDLYPSAIRKIAVRLEKVVKIRDIESIPEKERKLEFLPMRSGVDVIHKDSYVVDEAEYQPGTIRLVFPGGVKIAAQLQEGKQARTKDGEPVDLILDFETIANKGAIALFAMMDPENCGKGLTLEQCAEIFESMEPQEIDIEGTIYQGYVGTLPCFRPAQRYLDLSKPGEVTVDFVAKAIMRKDYTVKRRHEKEYSDLRAMDRAIGEELYRLISNPIPTSEAEEFNGRTAGTH